jgi:hypothetical protein
MEKPILRASSSPISGTEQLLLHIDTWLEIINVSKLYIERKYPKMNLNDVDYLETDKKYREFNLQETMLFDDLPENSRNEYEELNATFMQFHVFQNANAKEVVAHFQQLLNFRAKQDAASPAAKDHLQAFADLDAVDHLSNKSNADMVLRYKRLYLLRKEDFLKHMRIILTSKNLDTKKHFGKIKELYEKEADYATSALAEIQSQKGPIRVGNRKEYDLAEKRLIAKKKEQIDDYRKDQEELDLLISTPDHDPEQIEPKKRTMLEKLKNRNVEIDILTKLYEREASALTAKEVLKKKWEDFKDEEKNIEKRVTNVDLYAASAGYFVENSAKYIAKSMFEKPAPKIGTMVDHMAKDLAETGAMLAVTVLLGPFGASLAGPFVKEGFKALWGVEEPEDPNIARFDKVYEKLDNISRQLDLTNEKLDDILKRFDEINESIGKLDALLKITLRKTQLEDKIQKVQAAITNVKNLYQNTFSRTHDSIDEVHIIEKLDDDMLGILADLFKLLWSPRCELSRHAFHFDDSAQEHTFAYSINQLAKDPAMGDGNRFERIIELIDPLTRDILDLCSDYLQNRDALAMILRVYYTMVNYPDKNGTSNRQEQLFTNLRSFFDNATCQEMRTRIQTVRTTFEQHLAPGFRNKTLYYRYQIAKNNPADVDFTQAFGIETFDPQQRDDTKHGRPVRYNYNNKGFFEHTPKGDYARFFFVHNQAVAGSEFHGKGHALLYCVNDDFDQRFVPVKIGAGLANDEIYLFGAGGLEGSHFRVVPLHLDCIQEKDADAKDPDYLGQFDQLWESGKSFEIQGDKWIGLPVRFMRLLVRYPTRANSSLFLVQQNTLTGEEVQLGEYGVSYTSYANKPGRFSKIVISFKEKAKNQAPYMAVQIEFSNEYKIALTEKKNLVPELATFDLLFNAPSNRSTNAICWIDNRYTFASLHMPGRLNKLKAGTKLPLDGLHSAKNSYHLQIREDGSLTWSIGLRDIFWFAGIEEDTTAPITGILAVFDFRGNLVLYNKEGKAAWKSDTVKLAPTDKVHLQLQDDRNLVIYNQADKALWASDTYERKEEWRWCVGERLSIGNSQKSGKIKNRQSKITMQADGNLVFKFRDYNQEVPLKDTGTWKAENKGQYAVLRPDGIIAVYNEQHKEVGRTPNSAIKDLGKGAYLEVAIDLVSGMISNDYMLSLKLKTHSGTEKGKFWEVKK